jgi:hypothetical protein
MEKKELEVSTTTKHTLKKEGAKSADNQRKNIKY